METLSDHNSKDVLLTLCENSEGPQNSGEFQCEVRNNNGILQYRLLNTSILNSSTTTPTTQGPIITETTSITGINSSINGNNNNTTTNNAIPTQNCQYFVINDISLAASRPCLISPKINSNTNEEKPILIGNSKKRDEKRRATHNEVERRRRDKINQWILKLKDLLPDNQETEAKSKLSSVEYSKSGILIRACEYVRNIKEQNESLQECLKENEKELIKLRNENENLKLLLANKPIKMESELDFDIS